MSIQASGALAQRADYETPHYIFERIGYATNRTFVLDAAATASNAKCEHFISPQDNALICDWRDFHPGPLDGAVFCNPPYGRQLPRWVQRFRHASLEWGMDVAALLPGNAADTNWFRLAMMSAQLFWFFKRRINFELSGIPQTKPAVNNVLFVWKSTRFNNIQFGGYINGSPNGMPFE